MNQFTKSEKYVNEEYIKTSIGLLPKDWSVLKAGEIFSNHTNKNHKGNLEVLSATQDRGIIPRSQLDIDIKYDMDSLKKYKKVEPGDFVISLRSFQGGIEYSKFEGLVSPAYTVLKNEIEIDGNFYKYLFKKEDFITRLNSFIYGIRDGKQIGYNDFKDLKVQYPPLEEQRKISSILSTWDKAIELKEKLIEQKKQQKKGLMQKLLTGEVRLPGFDGEWEQVRLGELAKLQGGYAFKSSMFKEKGIPIVRISNILPEITDYNQEFVYYDEIKISDNFMVQYGDILIAMSGATTGKVGIYKKNEIAYLNQRVGKFVNLDKSKLDYGYLYYLVTSTKFKTQLTEELATGAQPNISSKQIENFKFKIPSINEQISISKILAQFDKFISLQEKELIYLKQQKKGLMQLLLTGKVRVKV